MGPTELRTSSNGRCPEKTLFMKCKAIRALQLVLGLILFSAGGPHDSGFDLMVEQVRAIGPGPWVRLITGVQLNGWTALLNAGKRWSNRVRT
jgi:hypothetical protein